MLLSDQEILSWYDRGENCAEENMLHDIAISYHRLSNYNTLGSRKCSAISNLERIGWQSKSHTISYAHYD
jgi:hypothetical protein